MHDGAAGALLAFARIIHRLLRRQFRDRHALQADREPRAVHHREHAMHALVFFADEEAGGAAFVAIDHGAGGRGIDAELVLDRMRAHVVALAVRHDLRHQEQRDALGAGRRVGQPGEHEMDDVVGQIVLAIGDEDFRAGDAVAAVGRAFRLAAQRADVGARLRLGELHGAHPFAADQLRQISALEFVAAVARQRVDRRHGQHRADAERHRARIPHFDAGGVDGVRQFLAAIFGGPGKPVPAGGGPGGVGLFPARRHGDGAVLERGAGFVADPVERGDHVAGEAAGFLQHLVDHLLVEIAVKPFLERGAQAGGVFERESDVGDGGAVGHVFILSGPQCGSTRAGKCRV